MKSLHLGKILFVIGFCIVCESLFMAISLPISWYYNETVTGQFAWAVATTFFSGLLLLIAFRKTLKADLSIKDSFVVVSFTWIFISIFGALPYMFTQSVPEFKNAFFETVSGFTTTGSSIMTDIEIMPKSILFWRAMTHWLGGMGIIVLVIAILPYLKVSGNHLIAAEGSLFSSEKIKPKIRDVASRLWLIYVVITAAQILSLVLAGMPFFDSACHSFATVATGGFGTKNSSIIDYSPAIQYIITFFMFIAGVNFSLHYLLVHKKFKATFSNEELKSYFFIVLAFSLLISFYIYNFYDHDYEMAFRQALFNVVSLITCTGFASANYELWPTTSMLLLVIVMLIGGSTGSTAGGIKVARFVVLYKTIKESFYRHVNPKMVVVSRYNGKVISDAFKNNVISFISIYLITILVGSLFLLSLGLDIYTAFSSVITTLGGIGPGFGSVGPIENFASLPDMAKYYLSFNMILGRLEIISLLTILHPGFYKV